MGAAASTSSTGLAVDGATNARAAENTAVRAIADFEADDTQATKELSFREGEALIVIGSARCPSGWSKAENVRGESGLVPTSYVEEMTMAEVRAALAELSKEEKQQLLARVKPAKAAKPPSVDFGHAFEKPLPSKQASRSARERSDAPLSKLSATLLDTYKQINHFWYTKSKPRKYVPSHGPSLAEAVATPVVHNSAVLIAEAAQAACQARKGDHVVEEASEEEEAFSLWATNGGGLLELLLQVDPVLGDAPVRLVDARFLVELQKRGCRLPRRQDMPDEAFLSLDYLKKMGYGNLYGINTYKKLHVLAVSHAWLQPDHPDPYSFNLKALASVLDAVSSKCVSVEHGFVDVELDEHGIEVDIYQNGAWLQYCSLHQKGPDGKRTEAEAALFDRALSQMQMWYAHQNITTLKLTELPDDHPARYNFPAGVTANTAEYANRGWCFFEAAVSNVVSKTALDLGALNRPPTSKIQEGNWLVRESDFWPICKIEEESPDEHGLTKRDYDCWNGVADDGKPHIKLLFASLDAETKEMFKETCEMAEDTRYAKYWDKDWVYFRFRRGEVTTSEDSGKAVRRIGLKGEAFEDREHRSRLARLERDSSIAFRPLQPRGWDRATLDMRVIDAMTVDQFRIGPPLPPDKFREQLALKAFTSKKADESKVAALYEETFRRTIAAAKELRYGDWTWTDGELLQIVKMIKEGPVLAVLHTLEIQGDKVTDGGVDAMIELLRRAPETQGADEKIDKLPVLRSLILGVTDADKYSHHAKSISLDAANRLAQSRSWKAASTKELDGEIIRSEVQIEVGEYTWIGDRFFDRSAYYDFRG